MKFAYFSHVWRKKNLTPHERYELLWRELELADDLKFDYGFCVEHHFSPGESWMSAPSLFTAAALGKVEQELRRIQPLQKSCSNS